jgi:hypothetical protein
MLKWILIVIVICLVITSLLIIGNAVNKVDIDWDMKATDLTLRHVVGILLCHAVITGLYSRKS